MFVQNRPTQSEVFVHFCFNQAANSINISSLLICICSFDLSCPILEKKKKKNLYTVL